MRKRKKGFTLVEVLAALGVIIVLTLALTVTVRAQVERANRQNLEALVATVNTQIMVAYDTPGRQTADFASTAALVQAAIITQEQAAQLAQASYAAGQSPPAFTLR